MLRVDQVHVIRHKVLVEGRSQRQVAKEFGISRVTVRKYIEEAMPVRKEGAPRARPVWETVGPRLEALLVESGQWTAGKQQLTATRLHELAPYVGELFASGPPLAVAAPGRGGKSLKELSEGLDADVRALAEFRAAVGDRATVDVLELRAPARALAVRDPVFILQHPQPEGATQLPMQLSIGTTLACSWAELRTRYDASTLPGSSGSPVFDADLECVGLHHAGDPAWVPRYNQAIPLAAIVADLATRAPELADRQIAQFWK